RGLQARLQLLESGPHTGRKSTPRRGRGLPLEQAIPPRRCHAQKPPETSRNNTQGPTPLPQRRNSPTGPRHAPRAGTFLGERARRRAGPRPRPARTVGGSPPRVPAATRRPLRRAYATVISRSWLLDWPVLRSIQTTRTVQAPFFTCRTSRQG